MSAAVAATEPSAVPVVSHVAGRERLARSTTARSREGRLVADGHPWPDGVRDVRLAVAHAGRLDDPPPDDLGVRRALERLDDQPEHLVADVRVVEPPARRRPGRQVAQPPDLERSLGRAVDAGRDPGRVAEQVVDGDAARRSAAPGTTAGGGRPGRPGRAGPRRPAAGSTAAVNVLPIDPISNSVSRLDRAPAATSASAATSLRDDRPADPVTARASPGTPPSAR